MRTKHLGCLNKRIYALDRSIVGNSFRVTSIKETFKPVRWIEGTSN